MADVDAEWNQFLLQLNDQKDSSHFIYQSNTSEDDDLDPLIPEREEGRIKDEYVRKECEALYISTQTKIFYLNVPSLDVESIFWNLPIMEYGLPQQGIIKKQMRMIFKSPEEYEVYAEKIKDIPYHSEKIIKQINNPNARKLKFKDERKLTVGISKKDIMNCHGKEKKAFINCFAMILRMASTDKTQTNDKTKTNANYDKTRHHIFHEVHVKVFNTGKITIPGIVDNDDTLLEITKKYILDILQANVKETLQLIPEDEIPLLRKIVKNKKGKEYVETEEIDKSLSEIPKNSHVEYVKQQSGVLINSNFNCGFYIDQMKLMRILQEKYHLEPTYNKSNYPGVKCKFYLNNALPLDISVQSGNISEEDKKKKITEWRLEDKYTKVTFVIFRTGNNLILGNFSKTILLFIFEFVKYILMTEYEEIRTYHDEPTKVAKQVKPRKKKVVYTKDYFQNDVSNDQTI
jgi:hypothetical protein